MRRKKQTDIPLQDIDSQGLKSRETYRKALQFFLDFVESNSRRDEEDKLPWFLEKELCSYRDKLSRCLAQKGPLKSILELPFMNQNLLADILANRTPDKKVEIANQQFNGSLQKNEAIISNIIIQNSNLVVIKQAHPFSPDAMNHLFHFLDAAQYGFDPKGKLEIRYQEMCSSLVDLYTPPTYYLKICGDVEALDLLKLLEVCQPLMTDAGYQKKKEEFEQFKLQKTKNKEAPGIASLIAAAREEMISLNNNNNSQNDGELSPAIKGLHL